MVYVVLKRGCLEIYSNKESYEQGENMKEKIKLVNLRLTQKLNEFHFEYNSFSLVICDTCVLVSTIYEMRRVFLIPLDTLEVHSGPIVIVCNRAKRGPRGCFLRAGCRVPGRICG